MDALELLKQDHQKVKKLFETAKDANEKQLRKLFEQIQAELETHTRIEVTVFYPAMGMHEELKDVVLESLEEHKQIKTLLGEMDSLDADSDKFAAKLQILMENVEHHAEEEEEGKMFPKIRKIVDQQKLKQLGADLETAKGHNRSARPSPSQGGI